MPTKASWLLPSAANTAPRHCSGRDREVREVRRLVKQVGVAAELWEGTALSKGSCYSAPAHEGHEKYTQCDRQLTFQEKLKIELLLKFPVFKYRQITKSKLRVGVRATSGSPTSPRAHWTVTGTRMATAPFATTALGCHVRAQAPRGNPVDEEGATD